MGRVVFDRFSGMCLINIPTPIPITDPKEKVNMLNMYFVLLVLSEEDNSMPKQKPTTNLCEAMAPSISKTCTKCFTFQFLFLNESKIRTKLFKKREIAQNP